jgi:cell division ATPase FtsA
MNLEFFNKKQKYNFFLCLDIGTEAVKAIILKKERLEGESNKKIIVLGNSKEYFNKSGIFDNTEFQKDILKKAISKAIKSVAIQSDIKQKFALYNPYSKNLKLNKKYKNLDETILLSLPASFLKTRIVSRLLKRKEIDKKISKIEAKSINQKVLKDVKIKVSEEFAQEFGILPQDIKIVSIKFIEKKVDGYAVPKLQNYKGKVLEFRILITFLPRNYLRSITEIIKDLRVEASPILGSSKNKIKKTFDQNLSRFISEKVKITYSYQNLSTLQKVDDSAVFLDIGGEITQIFLVRKGNLYKTGEFKIGGRVFSQSLSEAFGIEEYRARELKKRYSKKLLNPESAEKIKEILESQNNAWLKGFKSEIRKMNMGKIFPTNIFIFGGASQLPEIEKSLHRAKDIVKEIKFILPKDFTNIEDVTNNLKTSQSVPCLLTSYSI